MALLASYLLFFNTADGTLIVEKDTPAPRERCQLRSARISHVRVREGG